MGEHSGFRTEHDTMGEVQVPADALWRAQTQRAVENFPISGRGLERAQIRALGLVKAAAARANKEIGALDASVADAIADAADEVAEGLHDAHFPVDVFQTGSGTSSNMNANEVIATLAERAGVTVHPNDHVNASQSSNDVFPTTIHLATAEALTTDVIPALEHLATALRRRATEWADVVTAGRTHLMDAVPITLGQEAGAWATQVEYGVARIGDALPRVAQLPIGGTAVGTGLNAPAGFGAAVVERLRAATGLDVLTEAPDHIEAQASRDGLVEASGALRTVAVSLYKIANDIRWLSSGPRTGLAELHLPDLQPGSSIMPGKVNPVICEATMMVAAQVIGNDATVAFSGTQGNLQLNVMMPVMARNVLESARLLANVARLLADKVVDGAQADVERTREFAESSPAIVTPLNRYLGYEEAAAVAKQALKEKRTIRDVVLERGHVKDGTLTEEQLDTALDVLAMTRGGRRPRTVGGPCHTRDEREGPEMTAAEAIRPREEPRLLTVADYAQLGETPSGYAELTEGRVEYVPSPLVDHNVASAEVRDQIKVRLPPDLICVLDIDVDLQLVPADQPGFCRRPDLVVIGRDAVARQRRDGGLVQARDVRVIMETISPGSRRTDTVVKRAEYADAGIPHYWILDLADPASLLTLHAGGELGYVVTGEHTGRVALTEPFPVALDLDALL